MLDKALALLVGRLNGYLHQRFDLDEDLVQLGSPVSPDGVLPVEANDKVLVFLTNVNKETLPHNQPYGAPMQVGVRHVKPLFLNLYVVVAANFRTARYSEALSFLSAAITCFQQSNVIDKSVQSDMPQGIDKLIVDIENTNLGEASNLWGILGGKYLPSVMYKVRMVCIDESLVAGHVAEVSQVDV